MATFKIPQTARGEISKVSKFAESHGYLSEGKSAQVMAGVGGALDALAFAKDPNLKSASKALQSIGTMVAMTPPPTGPVIGGVLLIAGSVMSMFSKQGPPEPSAEMKMLTQVS